jgi:hypothetical protein
MADFVSEAMLQSEGYIVSSKPKIKPSSSSPSSSTSYPKVEYIRGSAYKTAKDVAVEIVALLKKKVLKPDDIFILSASVKTATFIKTDEKADMGSTKTANAFTGP